MGRETEDLRSQNDWAVDENLFGAIEDIKSAKDSLIDECLVAQIVQQKQLITKVFGRNGVQQSQIVL